MSNNQTTLGSIDADTTASPPSNRIVIETSLRNAGVRAPARQSLIAAFDSLEALLNTPDTDLKEYDQVGPSAIETIRVELDPDYVAGDYTITETDDGMMIDEWVSKTGAYMHIATGEAIINQLLSAQELGHHATISNKLVNWVSSDPTNKTAPAISDALKEAAYDLTPTELNFQRLLPREATYESPADLEDAVESAVSKASLLIKFCRATGRHGVCIAAASTARQELRDERAAKKEARKRELKAQQLLGFTIDNIDGWKRVPTPHLGELAYQGWFRDRPTVVALYETEEFTKVRAFPFSSWKQAHDATNSGDDQAPDLTDGEQLDEVFSNPTGMTPETLEAGALDLHDWLTTNDSEDRPDIPLSVNGWILHTWTFGETLQYEIPDHAEIEATPDSLILRASDETQTVPVDDFDQSAGQLREYIGLNPAPSEGGSPIEAPIPDGE